MLQTLRGDNKQGGFTLIELMIVIAIIGILAAIAIPNFISYRNKSFCSAAESDANAVASALADYYAIPSNTSVPTVSGLGVDLSGDNTATIVTGDANPNNGITITVTDGSTRCPVDYRTPSNDWSNDASGGVYTKFMN